MVDEAARRCGLDAEGADVMRSRNSVHVVLPRAGTVARVEGPGWQRLAERQVAVARALEVAGAPTARLVHPELQPFLIGDGAVTLWRQVRPVGAPTLADVGRAVRAIHDATVARRPAGVPEIDPLSTIVAMLDEVGTRFDKSAVGELRRRADRLSIAWRDGVAGDPLGTVVVHGDAHQDNAVVTAGGVVLLDLEDAGVGPASWDFAPLAVGVKRYGVSEKDYESFAGGYGANPAGWAGHELMRDVYELLVTAWAVTCGLDSPAMAAEAEVRVAGVLDGDPTRWTQR